MKPIELLILISLTIGFANAQTNFEQVSPILQQQIQSADVAEFQLRQYLMRRVPKLPTPTSAEQWTAEAMRIRRHLLEDIIFHGWPGEWVNAPPKFEDMGLMEPAKGYRMRKLRFEIVPGFQSTAILYEPENFSGTVPAILNLNGHTPEGKAAEYKQKRCINYAKMGMFALSLEWLNCGELSNPENVHWFGAHLNLVGANATGLFYLAMRKGLDYLYEHPSIDRRRLGVTGLSGGAWQTILLSSLDERVAVAIPVSGYFAFVGGIERNSDIGDIEYNPPDLRVTQDYTHLTAMRAPRPTLLIYGAEDEYGIKAPLEKPYLFDEVKPFFGLFGKEEVFAWHENTEPGTHNYQLDNRQQSYRFFTKHFNIPIVDHEIPVDSEIKSSEELVVGLPENNLTILGLARRLADGIKRQPLPEAASAKAEWIASARARLKKLVDYKPVTVEHAWSVSSSRNTGLETHSYRFQLSNDLSATGIWLKALTSPANSAATIVMADNAKRSAGKEVSERLNRGEQVVAVDLLFTGDASPDRLDVPKGLWSPSALYTQLLASVGDRPVGIETAQLIGILHWLKETRGAQQVRLETTGIRSQAIALIASALEPTLFSEVLAHEGMRSLVYLLDTPVAYQDAPDLFCLDLYRELDLDRLAILAQPTKVIQKYLGSDSYPAN